MHYSYDYKRPHTVKLLQLEKILIFLQFFFLKFLIIDRASTMNTDGLIEVWYQRKKNRHRVHKKYSGYYIPYKNKKSF